MSADSERGVLGNAAGFLTGVGQGLWSAGKATVVGAVEGVSAVGQAGYQLATDPQYRGEVWRSTVEGARAVRDYAGEAVRDPSRVVRDVREGAGAAIDTAGTMLHELNEERKKAAAEGRSAEFYGNITGKVAFELIPAGKVGKALGVVGKSGKLGKVAGALDKLDDLGDGVKALDKVQDVAKAGKKLDRALDGKKAVKGIGKAKAKKATANAKSAKGKKGKGKGKKSTKKRCAYELSSSKSKPSPKSPQQVQEEILKKHGSYIHKDQKGISAADATVVQDDATFKEGFKKRWPSIYKKYNLDQINGESHQGKIYINASKANPGTHYHEQLHHYSHPDFQSSFGSVGGMNLNEGFTEFFTRDIYSGNRKGIYDTEAAIAGAIHKKVGYETMQKAYFSGDHDSMTQILHVVNPPSP